MFYSFQNQKGGVGKTTLAIHFAHALTLKDYRVLLVDTDPQGSSLDWAATREEPSPFQIMGFDRPTVHKDLSGIARDYDHVVIDSPPRVADIARSAILAADLVVIPVQPSPYDVWAANDVISIIKEALVFKENLKTVFAINRKIVNTAIGRDVAKALEEFGFPILKTHVCQRVVFAESGTNGSTVLETDPKGKAALEIWSLTKELLDYGSKRS